MDEKQTKDQRIAFFVERCSKSDGAERANSQLFLTELCGVLCVDHPSRPSPKSPTSLRRRKNVVIDNRNGTYRTKLV